MSFRRRGSEKKENYSIVSVSGKIDAATCSELEDSLLNLLDEGETRIILNMSDCQYISSAGLRILLDSHSIIEENCKVLLTDKLK